MGRFERGLAKPQDDYRRRQREMAAMLARPENRAFLDQLRAEAIADMPLTLDELVTMDGLR
jgi:hypothetical protein